VDYVPFDGQGFICPDDIKKMIKPNTRLVIVNHGSNVIGTLQPLREIGLICRTYEIPFAVDASQSAGQVPIDIKESLVDVIAFTGHKSLMGPTGIGGLYVREGIEIRFTRAGGTGVRSAQRTHLEEYPYRLEYGTPNIVGIAGLYAGVNWVKKQGIENIHEREMELLRKLRDGLREIQGVTLYCQDSLENHIAVMLFNIDGLEATEVATLLDVDYNIACRAGLQCAPLVHEQLGTDKIKGGVRFSLGKVKYVPVYDVQLSAGVIEVMNSGIQDMIVGRITPDNLAKKIQQEYEKEK